MIFDDQISKRRDRETQALREVFGDTAKDMGFTIDPGNTIGSGNRVLHLLLRHLKVTDYNLDDDGLFTPDEQLERILRPRNIMQRRITLSGDWWHRAIGPKLGQDKEGNMLLFLPRKWVFGYICIDQKGEERNVDAELMKNIKREALDFFPALPSRPLKAIDLLKYVASNLPSSTVFAVLLTASMAALIGMFVPFINKEIFHNVIPNGIIQALFPIAALFLGVVIGTAMMEVMRNKLMIRLKDSISISLQHAVMARIISLDTSFFWI